MRVSAESKSMPSLGIERAEPAGNSDDRPHFAVDLQLALQKTPDASQAQPLCMSLMLELFFLITVKGLQA